MRNERTLRLAGYLAAVGGALAIGVLAPLDASAQISNSRHNLSASQTTTSSFTASGAGVTQEICVFCHTPHGANTDVKAPLWNKAASTATYQMYSTGGSYSIDGAEASTVGSVSVACLSCHDGSLAINTMINLQGSGGYTPTTGSLLAGTWTNADTNAGVDPATNKMRAGVIQNLGTDLRNDHPISIQFCGGGLNATLGATSVTGTCADADFHANRVQTKQVNGNQIFWVDSGTVDSVRQKTDLALYTQASLTGPTVECASCHDPHTTANPTFLRVSNSGSDLCLTCHNK